MQYSARGLEYDGPTRQPIEHLLIARRARDKPGRFVLRRHADDTIDVSDEITIDV